MTSKTLHTLAADQRSKRLDDLLHLAHQKGFDPQAILEQANGHFMTEASNANHEQRKDKDVWPIA